ncbi:hypothetical protein L208DRAFT_1354508 [Tricholoma matsutake]|nr:hypothetical protein L208DRAFT_1354508 [Tricholoma matsutake 945]
MPEYDISFSSSSSTEAGSFKLLELPKDLCNLLETAIQISNPFSLKVKGQANEDAVLCTNDKTFTMRSVMLSNSVLVVTSPPDGSSDYGVVIRDQVSEIMELTPSVPKLHKLAITSRGREYDEGQEDDDVQADDQGKRLSYEDVRAQIQASDDEFNRALKDRHILNINGKLQPIAPSYLSLLLELILNLLVSLSLPYDGASVEELSSTLADEHEIAKGVSTQVMSWFGNIREGKWSMDINAVSREIGLNILRHHKNTIKKDELLTKWKSIVGDTFGSSVSVSLLSGNYLASASDAELISYFPASALPIEAAPRFADLFLTRSRWKAEEISPFLADIAIDSKERDKLLLKFARAITDAQGVWYTARAQFNA